MTYTDALHSLFIADSEHDPLAVPPPSREALKRAYESMIISASGWRKIFAASGEEEDTGDEVNSEDLILTALSALAFVQHLTVETPSVLVGLDARPTGRILGEVVVRTLLSLGCSVRYLFIASAPQIMAASTAEGCDGFFYISASHNPIGHNGFKMGKGGGVYDGESAKALASIYASLVSNPAESIKRVQQLSADLDADVYRRTLEAVNEDRSWSLAYYNRFALETAAKSKNEREIALVATTLKAQLASSPLGIVGELNGSARSASIDEPFLTAMGVKVALYNNVPGAVVHPIVPEGENLDLCRSLLEERYKEDPSYLLGYSVDNDGDRGNIVYIDEPSGEARILDAQSVYALAALSELAQSRLKEPDGKLATVVNGPTSMRIDEIAARFGAQVFRSEVGEANVVGLAELKRREGWKVPILGEGSNGGNITHPARVRDPLNTLVSLIQLLRNRAVADLWFTKSNLELPTRYTLSLLIESLPPYITTGAFSPTALMKIAIPHRDLKNRYEAALEREWARRKEELSDLGFHSYRIYQTEGLECRRGGGEAYRTPPYTGGFKVALLDTDEVERAYLWMRGSKTEPVFRLMVDLSGSNEATYEYLLAWHRSLISEASTP